MRMAEVSGLLRWPAIRAVLIVAATLMMLVQSSGTARASDYCGPGETPVFRFGFAYLKSLLGSTMGEPLECEHANPENGDTLQQTTTGLSFYRKATNTPTFTDGWNHWGWTAAGLVYWTGSSVDPPASADVADAPGVNAQGRIVFSSNRDVDSNWSWDIWVMDADGGNVQQLTDASGHDGRPAWSPDRTQIAFERYYSRDFIPNIYVMDADGGNVRRITDDPGERSGNFLSPGGSQSPTWSPDGTRIAYSSFRDGNWNIFVMDADGGNVQRLTQSWWRNRWPAWSPDGTRIAYVRDILRGVGPNIYSMDANGGNVSQLTDAGSDYSPAWSPDGTRIAFSSSRNGWRLDPELFVMNADGRNVQQLTQYPQEGHKPSWSPDGSQIVFHAQDGGFYLFIMDANGENIRQMMEYPESGDGADW